MTNAPAPGAASPPETARAPGPLLALLERQTRPAGGDGAAEGDRPAPSIREFGTPIGDLRLYRSHGPTPRQHQVYGVSLCAIVQGAKGVAAGDRVLRYGAGDFLAAGVDLPVVTHVTEAAPGRPYLALALRLDPDLLFDVAQDVGRFDRQHAGGAGATLGEADPGLFVGAMGEQVRRSLERIAGLLDTPEAVPALYTPAARTLYYWLLRGPHGAAVAQMAFPGGHARRIAAAIAAAIAVMKERFPGPVRVAKLAEAARMSPSRFHVHFKTVTSATPIQYYKRLRLLEARRLLVSEGTTARAAAYATGYESPSQFGREYKRLFGTPPGQDAGLPPVAGSVQDRAR